MKEHRILGSGGVTLYAREWGEPDAPTLVLVHGYPDTCEVWNPLLPYLTDRYHVVAYDVRGAGRSEPGWSYGGYELHRLVGDLKAVLDITAPGKKVHLVGHDWGAIQGWEAVTGARIARRFASYTAFGAPCLDHASRWIRNSLSRPDPRRLATLAAQATRSWYICTFHLPGIVPLAWLSGAGRAWFGLMRRREGIRPSPEYAGPSAVDAKRGMWMYRANFTHKLLHPGEGRTEVPVQMVIGGHDLCVAPALYEETASRVPGLWRRDLPEAGHWIQLTHPERLAAWITELVEVTEDRARREQAQAPPKKSRHGTFHPLRVAEIERLTVDSVAVTFAVPETLRAAFRFTQGQHITVQTDLGGEGVRRNYSICEPVSSDRLRIGIKLLPGGTFSTYAMEQLQVGDVLEIMTPTGRFSTELDPANVKHYVGIAGGSGITPILSILATVLEEEEKGRCTLLYGNRTWDSIMFRDELAALRLRYPDRLRIRHFLSDEPADSPILADGDVAAGQLTPERLAGLFEEFVAPEDADEWFLCGPQPMALAARNALLAHGADVKHVHQELFVAGSTRQPGVADPAALAGVTPSEVTVIVDDEETSFPLVPGTETILDAAMRIRGDMPYSCLAAACATCRAKVCTGSVEMTANHALDDDEIAEGYVLTCQARPTTPTVVVNYDL